MNNWMRQLTLVVIFALGLSACASKGPATKYYGLFSDDSQSEQTSNSALPSSIGIGPVILPGYLENPAIVSRTSGQRIIVSGYHAWAEPFNESIARVLSRGVSNNLGHTAVFAFPWDSRARPNLQVRVQLDQLDGIRGEKLKLSANLLFIDNTEKNALKYSKRVNLDADTSGKEYADYVAAINLLVNELAEVIASEIASQ